MSDFEHSERWIRRAQMGILMLCQAVLLATLGYTWHSTRVSEIEAAYLEEITSNLRQSVSCEGDRQAVVARLVECEEKRNAALRREIQLVECFATQRKDLLECMTQEGADPLTCYSSPAVLSSCTLR